MTTRVGINGFGRIGRQVLRAAMERHPGELEVVAVNDLADPKVNAHLFKYDSNTGVFPGTVQAIEGGIEVNGHAIKSISERDPAKLPWGDLGVDLVIESTGFFTNGEKAAAHIEAGAKKVIISAPATNEDKTMVLGVNEHEYDKNSHHVVSNASCTTNCVAMLIKVLNDSFGIKHGLMTTVHAYTNDQQILDQVHPDLRRARAAAVNIIFVANLERDVTVEEVNAAFKAAAEGALAHVLEYTEDPIVSSDIRGNANSCIVDGLSTMVMAGNMVKVLGWYDNEWGYSCRTSDLAAFMVEQGI
jgi:glyceraldehyde 3-phosphate dehydrogenase